MLPELKSIKKIRKTYDGFGGLNLTCACAPNEFSDMSNLTTENYPCITTRPKRTVRYKTETDASGNVTPADALIETGAKGITAGVSVCGKIVLCAGDKVFYDGNAVSGITLSASYHGIVPFGRSFFIIPENILVTPADSGLTVTAVTAPIMDFAVCRGNRIYGCRFGDNSSGSFVNEIYVCKQGDATAWNTYDGISTDSYTASVGVSGEFTGIAVCLDKTVFFKEDMLITMSGDCPAEFSISCLPCEGAQAGSDRAIVNVGDSVYYLSRAGVTVWDGAYPRVISDVLGVTPCDSPCAGVCGGKYYLSVTRDGQRATYVYDTVHGLWSRESCNGTQFYIRQKNCLFTVNKTAEISSGAVQRKFYTVGTADSRFTPDGANIHNNTSADVYSYTEESSVPWSLKTGRISGSAGRQLRLRDVIISLNSASGSICAQISADGAAFVSAGTRTVNSPGLVRMKIRIPACDFVRLGLSGTAGCEITSMTLIYEERNKI